MMANTNGDLNIDLGARLNKLEQGLKDAQNKFKQYTTSVDSQSKKSSASVGNQWNSTLTAISGYMAAAFSVQAITQFAAEAVNLAAKAEGVEAAFSRLNNDTLLSELRKATRGTVTDLELMRQAVRAENFNVPLSQLATFFEFATKRAAQTGESVDYLVNSIIDGIGRKSTLVMDNLGISAARLQDEIKKTGDFGLAAGNIIQSELAKAGDVATTSAQKIDAISASWENLQVQVGKRLLSNSGILSNFSRYLDVLARSVKVGEMLTSQGMEAYDTQYKQTTEQIKRRSDEIIAKYGDVNKAQGEMVKQSAIFRAEAMEALKVDEVRGNKLLAMSDAYLAYANSITKSSEETKKDTQAVSDNTAAILAQADAIIKARKALKGNEISPFRLDLPTMDVNDKLGGNAKDQFSSSVKLMADNATMEMNRINEAFRQSNAVIATFGAALNQAFTEGITNGLNFGDALKQMFADLAKQMAAALLTALSLKLVLSALGLGAGMSVGSLFMGQFGLGGLINANSASGLGGGLGKMQIGGTVRQQGDVILNTLNTTYQNTGRWNNNKAG